MLIGIIISSYFQHTLLQKAGQRIIYNIRQTVFMKIEKTSEGIKVTEISGLSLPETLDCGQCFRWKADENGNWRGVVKGIFGNIRQDPEGITFIGADEKEFNEIWFDYFDFGRDYDVLKADFGANEMLREACEFAPGIRVLHQEPWEAFISFIISQNNNIARIEYFIPKKFHSSPLLKTNSLSLFIVNPLSNITSFIYFL